MDRLKQAYIINDWQTWEAYADKDLVRKDNDIFTDSPFLFEMFSRDGYRIHALSATIGDMERTRIARLSREIIFSWRSFLNTVCIESCNPVKFGEIMGRQLLDFVGSTLFRALQLDKIVSSFDETVIPYLSDDQQNSCDAVVSSMCPMQCNYFALLAQTGNSMVNSGLLRLIPIKRKITDIIPNARKNDGHLSVLSAFLLRIFALRFMVPKRWWCKILVSTGNKFPPARRSVFIFLESDYLIPVVAGLWRQGITLLDLVLPDKKNKAPPKNEDVSPSFGLTLRHIVESLTGHGPISPIEKIGVEMMCHRIELYMKYYLFNKISVLKMEIGKWATQYHNTKKIVVSNGLGTPEEIALQQLVRDQGVPFVTFEHGGIGLLRLYDDLIFCADMNYCSAYVAHNDYEKEFYRKRTNDAKTLFYVQGFINEVKPVFHTGARWLGRKLLNIHNSRRLVIYAPTRFREDCLGLEWESDDVPYWCLISKITFKIFSQCDDLFIIKLHQKGWRPYTKDFYKLRRHPFEVCTMPKNVRYIYYPQLNYIRWAADVLIVDRATSTLQWALACRNTPLIYLDLPMSPLQPDIRITMEKAVFLVDMSRPDWENILSGFLKLSNEELSDLWEKKRVLRDRFIENYVLGPDRPVSTLVQWLSNKFLK